jgi:uncharacterized membrane protein
MKAKLIVATLLIFCVARFAKAQTTYTFNDFSFPGASGTTANAINNSGQIAGTYSDSSSGRNRGFLLSGGMYTSIDFPGAVETYVQGLSNDGKIVGFFTHGGGFGDTYPFVLSGGVFSALPEAPGSLSGNTRPWSINTSGQIVGEYVDPCFCAWHAYSFQNGVYTTLNVPGFSNSSAFGLNDAGQIVGNVGDCYFGQDNQKGFLLSGGVFTIIAVPSAVSTQVTGINDTADMAGHYWDGAKYRSFVLFNGSFTLIDDPASQPGCGTAIWGQGINAARRIVGSYNVGCSNSHAFLGIPNPSHSASVQQPINADGSSVFRANRGVIPVKFMLLNNGSPTCELPPATIAVFRMSGSTGVQVNESEYIQSADTGSNFRIDTTNCQYIYNLSAATLGVGTYAVQIQINSSAVGDASFALK